MRSLLLPEKDARMAWEGVTKMFLKKDLHRFCVNNMFNLVDDAHCYGIIEVNKFIKISQNRFEEYKDLHNLTFKDKRDRWKPPNKTVYGYMFKFIEKHDPIKNVIVCTNKGEFTDLVLIRDKLTNKLIKNPSDYTPDDMPLEELLLVWGVLEKQYLMAKYCGMDFKIDDVLLAAEKIITRVEGHIDSNSLMYDLLKNG